MGVRERGFFDFLYYSVLAAAIVAIAAGLPACGKAGGPTGPGAEKYDTISAGGDEDLRSVKKHNADRNGGHVTRWDGGSVAVHDAVGVSDLQGVLNDWNGALGGKLTLVVGGSGSPITIVADGSVACGVADIKQKNYKTESAQIKLSSHCARNRDVVKHELGHAVGFLEHASDGGVMEPVTRNGTITDLYARTLRKLYDLKPGTIITD